MLMFLRHRCSVDKWRSPDIRCSVGRPPAAEYDQCHHVLYVIQLLCIVCVFYFLLLFLLAALVANKCVITHWSSHKVCNSVDVHEH